MARIQIQSKPFTREGLFMQLKSVSLRRVSQVQPALVLIVGLVFGKTITAPAENLLKNHGFEENAADGQAPPHWATTDDSAGKAILADKEVHGGGKAISIPPNTSVEQKVASVPAGPYLARCWVKSEAEQSVTFFVRNSEEPWAGYTCAEIKVPSDKWTQVEAFCVMDKDGPVTISFGGVSKEFHLYHGTEQDTAAPILADDFELVRYK
jgi:hypothetical protein